MLHEHPCVCDSGKKYERCWQSLRAIVCSRVVRSTVWNEYGAHRQRTVARQRDNGACPILKRPEYAHDQGASLDSNDLRAQGTLASSLGRWSAERDQQASATVDAIGFCPLRRVAHA